MNKYEEKEISMIGRETRVVSRCRYFYFDILRGPSPGSVDWSFSGLVSELLMDWEAKV